MAEEQTEASRYQSKYGGGFITPQAYIVEMICERMAQKNKTTLPVKFWNTPKWKKIFLTQLLAATSLLKIYSAPAIIAGLKRSYQTYSLHAKWLDDIFKEEQTKLDIIEVKKKMTPQPLPAEQPAEPIVEKPRESFTNTQSTIKKLRDLD